MEHRSSESGNILIYILIAVALLAALSFAVSETTRGNTQAVNSEKARLYGTEILAYADTVAKAVGQLRLRGCDESQLSFQNDVDTVGYTNGAAPGDSSCHIFDLNGGGVIWNVPPAEFLASATSPNDAWMITESNEIQNIGQTGGLSGDVSVDLVLFLKNVDATVCTELNELLGVDNPSDVPPTDNGADDAKFGGYFNFAQIIGDNDSALQGRKSACYTDGGETLPTGQHVFYRVLLAR